MALILHIADLHLVAPASSRPIADHKVGLVPAGNRTTHHDVLRLTLQRLAEALTQTHRHLDAIVVTGDIADKNNEGGYQAFLELLDALGAERPTPDRIVVVPGNHDVTAGLSAGDPRRYERFVRLIRDAGFVTPLLAGIDATPLPPGTDPTRHLVALEDIQIVPIDSAGYSQVLLDVGMSDASWARLETAVTGADLEALRRMRRVDAARISDRQLEDVRTLLGRVAGGIRPPLRIAVLHHHLLPVSITEEIKPFESLTNLGLIRQFLRDQGFAIVLHGHKHTQFTYVDHVAAYDVAAAPPSPIRVIAGAVASGSDLARADVFRLLNVDPDAGTIQVQRVAMAVPGAPFTIGNPETIFFSRPGAARVLETAGTMAIDGETVDVVYPRLVAALDGKESETDHVVCRIGRSPDMPEIAQLYPGLLPAPGTPEADQGGGLAAGHRLQQFRDLVEWWQFPTAPLSALDQPAFTHGSRIQRYSGHLDQLEQVIEALANDHTTSRGIVVLLNPEADKIAARDVPFPSFCLVQFKVRSAVGGPPALDCTAYFRKQEMRYWWLVNLAELAALQRQICDSLGLRRGQQEELRNIRPGSITTIAARAHAGQSAPKVQVPRIDRYHSLARERLFAMVNALVWEHMPGRPAAGDDWLRLFVELNPPATSDPDGLAVAQEGLKYLRDQIDIHVRSTEFARDERLRALQHSLDELLAANRDFASLQQREQVTAQRYDDWRADVMPIIQRVIELSYGRIVGR